MQPLSVATLFTEREERRHHKKEMAEELARKHEELPNEARRMASVALNGTVLEAKALGQ